MNAGLLNWTMSPLEWRLAALGTIILLLLFQAVKTLSKLNIEIPEWVNSALESIGVRGLVPQPTWRTGSYSARGRPLRKSKPLPRNRRSLTRINSMKDQSSSILMKLPLELRLRIWECVIGQYSFHIDLLDRRLGSRICGYYTYGKEITKDEEESFEAGSDEYEGRNMGQEDEEDDNEEEETDKLTESKVGLLKMCHQCPLYYSQSTDLCGYYPASKKYRILALLKSCRQIYAEALLTLYTTSTFIINDPGLLAYFLQSMPASHIRLIRILRLEWKTETYSSCLYHDRNGGIGEAWKRLWEIVGREMTGLRKVDVFVLQMRDKSQRRTWSEGWNPTVWKNERKRKMWKGEMEKVGKELGMEFEGKVEVRGLWMIMKGRRSNLS